MMIAPAPSPSLPRSPRRHPLDEAAASIDGAREDIARMEALLSPRDARDRDRGERTPT